MTAPPDSWPNLGGDVADVLSGSHPHDSMTYRGSMIYVLWERLTAAERELDEARREIVRREEDFQIGKEVARRLGEERTAEMQKLERERDEARRERDLRSLFKDSAGEQLAAMQSQSDEYKRERDEARRERDMAIDMAEAALAEAREEVAKLRAELS